MGLHWIVGGEADRAAAPLGTAAALLMVAGLGGAFLGQLLAFNLPPDPLWGDAPTVLSLPWGGAWSMQVVLTLATGVGMALAGRPRPAPFWWGLTGLVSTLAFTPASTGHAAGQDLAALAIGLDGLHVLAAGAWLGALGALFATVPRGPGSGRVLLRRIRRFSPVALVAAPVVAFTGLGSAVLHLAAVSDLWTSAYGRWLTVKVALFVAALLLGLVNWRRRTPELERSGDAASMRTTILAELGVALAIVAATAVLIRSTPPLPG